MADQMDTKNQNTVFYEIYPTNSSVNLEEFRFQCLKALESNINVIWNAECFNIEVHDTASTPHLRGKVWFDHCVEDEWYVVWLLRNLSRDLPVVVKVWDDDGCFVLIEAAEVLPSWLAPDNSDNRVLLYQGGFVLIPLPTSPAEMAWLPQNAVSIEQALTCAQKVRQSDEINKVVNLKLREFPNRSLHRIRCHLPVPLIHALTMNSSLVSSIISVYLLSDNREIQGIIKNRKLDWEDTFDTNVQLTRCQYAQLYSHRTSTINAWPHLPVGHVDHPSRQLGLKFSCGAELLLAIAEGSCVVNTNFSKYITRLTSFGYFGNTLEGSKAYSELLKKAEIFFQASRNPDSELPWMVNSRKLKFLIEEAISPEIRESYRGIEKVDESESDAWMDEIPGDVQKWFVNGKKADNMQSDYETVKSTKSDDADLNTSSNNNIRDMNTKLHGFIDKISSHEGAEVPDINLNADDFMDCLREFKDQVDAAAAAKEMSDSDETSSLDTESEEEMEEYMRELEEQLRGTTMSESFAKDEGGDLDIDLNLVSNILHSFSAETGLTGPASSVLASLGVHLPRDEDIAGKTA